MSKLDNEFEKEINEVKIEIDNKINQAYDLIQEATALSDKHGIPFYSRVCDIGQNYYPNSFRKITVEQKEKIAEILSLDEYQVRDAEDGYGWEHSAVGC